MDLSALRWTATVLLFACATPGAQAQPQQQPVSAQAAASCQNTGSFERWLDEFRQEARSNGVTDATIAGALDGMTFDSGIVNRDRRQGFFAQSFLSFSDKLITKARLQSSSARLHQHRDLLVQVEREYGVAPPLIVAFWALESDFGNIMGNLPVLRSLAALAYDCRRPELFRGELMDALRIIDRGDLRPEDMIGSWAGELGQTQFLPSHYLKHAIDYDGDGRRDLIKSIPDVIASTGNFMRFLGWQAGEPWLEEVRVPASLPWDQADLTIQHPRSKWAEWGVTLADGKRLPADGMPASLLLPMGRFGPAFLAYANFHVYLKWNQSLNYAVTAAHLATRIAGAPAMRRGNAEVQELTQPQLKELQQHLVRRGFFSGEADGRLGAATRAGVKAAQIKLGLPADSYPTAELLDRLREQR